MTTIIIIANGVEAICIIMTTIIVIANSEFRVEDDNKMVINAAYKVDAYPWNIQGLLSDVWSAEREFYTVSFKHIYREANTAADFIA